MESIYDGMSVILIMKGLYCYNVNYTVIMLIIKNTSKKKK